MSIDYAHTAAGLMVIATLEGEMKVNLGDWVIRGVQGEWSPAEWCTTDLSERASNVGAATGWILRVISDNRLEEGHTDDRWTQYRPCTVPDRAAGPGEP